MRLSLMLIGVIVCFGSYVYLCTAIMNPCSIHTSMQTDVDDGISNCMNYFQHYCMLYIINCDTPFAESGGCRNSGAQEAL